MVKRVTLFEAKDGEQFNTERAAIRHELLLDLIDQFGDVKYMDEIDTQQMGEFLLNNKSVIMTFLELGK